MNDDEKTITVKWVKSIAPMMISLTGIILCFVVGISANQINKTQIKITDANMKNQSVITENNNKSEQQLKSIEIFLELIKSENPREKEMGVRLLNILDNEIALKFASTIASNKSENKNIALMAFRIGKQNDIARFLEAILKNMNIYLSDKNTEEVIKYLNDPFSGYQQMAEIVYYVLDRNMLDGNAVPINIINAEVMRSHGKNTPILDINFFDIEKVKDAIFESWKIKNEASSSSTFKEIIY